MPYKFKKGGSVIETSARDIQVPLSKENLRKLLVNIMSGSIEYSHQDFANWCSKHFVNIVVKDLAIEDISIDEATYEVLFDVDVQWDLYLVNKYKTEELQTMDLSKVHLPKEWFENWLNQLK